jgi:hypothetical protein
VIEIAEKRHQEANTSQEPEAGGNGDVSACAAQTNMECWVHHDTILDDVKANQSLNEAWEHEDNKDELKIDLQGPERQFWLGTEAGRLGCYNFPGETWAGDWSAHKEKWVREESVSDGRMNVLWSEWAEKRKESTGYGQTGSSSSDTTGQTTRDRPTILV